MIGVVIASTRRFLAESLALTLRGGEHVDECVIVTNGPELRRAASSIGEHIVLYDLDAPVDELAELVDSADVAPGPSRRCGFFDEFHGRHAEVAFALSVTVLFPLTSEPAHICDIVLHGPKDVSVVASEGLTLAQLERLASLSPREVEVLQQLASGQSTQVVAHLLGITPHTVNSHKRRIFKKLDVQSQSQAVVMAAAGGVVPVDLS